MTNVTEISAEVPITWTEWELPTPRHRKLQPVDREGTQTVSLRVVAVEDAPLAFTVPPAYGTGEPNDIRTFDGVLYALDRSEYSGQTEPTVADEAWLRRAAARFALNKWQQPSEPEARKEISKATSGCVSIDGQLWVCTGEPQYAVQTFGMGHNHGGTSISYHESRNTNLREEAYWLADEYDQAVAAAVKVAEERGDNESINRILNTKPIIVHDPDAVGRQAVRVTRLDLPDVYYIELTEYKAVRAEYIRQLKTIPGAIVGRGGVTTVNYTKLTDHQAYMVKEMLKYPAEHGII